MTATITRSIDTVPVEDAAVLRAAARRAAPIFAAAGWVHADLHNLRAPSFVPTEADLLEVLARKWHEAGENGKCGGSGRLQVERWADEYMTEREHNVSVTLELAADVTRTEDFWDEGHGGLNPRWEPPADPDADEYRWAPGDEA